MFLHVEQKILPVQPVLLQVEGADHQQPQHGVHLHRVISQGQTVRRYAIHYYVCRVTRLRMAMARVPVRTVKPQQQEVSHGILASVQDSLATDARLHTS